MKSDDVVHVRSRRLVQVLIRHGCRPLRQHKGGSATFAATATVKNIITGYVEVVDARRVSDDVRAIADRIRKRVRHPQK